MKDSISFPFFPSSSNFDALDDISNHHVFIKNFIHIFSVEKIFKDSFFSSFFFFLNPNRWKDVGESRFFFFFFFQHLDNFLKSWPIKNLLALNTNEISLAGAKLSPLLGFLKFFPISEEIKSEKEGKEKKRKEGKKR